MTKLPIFLKPKRLLDKFLNNYWVKFVLFKEDNPVHRVIKNLNAFHVVIIVFLAYCVSGTVGFVVFAAHGFFGFLCYYVFLIVAGMEVVHFICDLPSD